MEPITEIPTEILTDVATNVDPGILSTFGPMLLGGGVIIGIVMFFLKYLNNTKVMKKEQKANVKEYKETIKEAKQEIPVLNKKQEEIVEQVQIQETKFDDVVKEQEKIIEKTLNQINSPLKNKSIEATNNRIKQTMSRIQHATRNRDRMGK